MKKALIAILLVLALSIAAFPYGAFAAESGIVIEEVDGYIYGVPERTTLSMFNTAYLRKGYTVLDAKGNAVTDNNAYLGTGFKVSYEASAGQQTTLSFVVLGDIDGNGRVTSGDYLNIRAHLKNTAKLTDVQKLAANINGDATISTFDYMLVKAHFMGTYDIYNSQKQPDDTSNDTSEVATPDPWTSGWA